MNEDPTDVKEDRFDFGRVPVFLKKTAQRPAPQT